MSLLGLLIDHRRAGFGGVGGNLGGLKAVTLERLHPSYMRIPPNAKRSVSLPNVLYTPHLTYLQPLPENRID